MKALMDAVATVSGGPTPFPLSQPFPNLHPAAAFGFANDMALANNQGGPLRKRNHDSALTTEGTAAGSKKAKTSTSSAYSTNEDEGKRVKRLEQNRTAAIESRRRKKHMVEELQRSVQYFSRANSALKSQNAELESQLLLAKHKILSKGSSDDVAASATTKINLPKTPASTEIEIANNVKASTENTKPAKLTSVGPLLTNAPPNKEMEEQARQAQFAATQALYKSMGYPAGAARIAASTFSQFVGQTGIAPGLSPAATTSSESVRPTKRNTITTPVLPPTIPTDTNSSKIESDGDAYIEALNQFAMQQAAAANAAAAAATAAIQAVNIHNQLKQNGGAFSSSSTSTPPTLPSFPFSIPNTNMTSWPFQNASSPLSKKE
jgi:hypothetical protein